MFEELEMVRFNCVLLASVLLLVTATGCNNSDQANEDIATTPMAVRKKAQTPNIPTATPVTSSSPGQAKTAAAPANSGKAKAAAPAGAAKPQKQAAAKTDMKQTLAKLDGYIPAAVKALQANDVATAKEYTKAFSDNWQQKIIQFSVKSGSQASYNKISANVTQVNNAMKAATPDKTKAIAALQSLSKSVDEYTKSR